MPGQIRHPARPWRRTRLRYLPSTVPVEPVEPVEPVPAGAPVEPAPVDPVPVEAAPVDPVPVEPVAPAPVPPAEPGTVLPVEGGPGDVDDPVGSDAEPGVVLGPACICWTHGSLRVNTLAHIVEAVLESSEEDVDSGGGAVGREPGVLPAGSEVLGRVPACVPEPGDCCGDGD